MRGQKSMVPKPTHLPLGRNISDSLFSTIGLKLVIRSTPHDPVSLADRDSPYGDHHLIVAVAPSGPLTIADNNGRP